MRLEEFIDFVKSVETEIKENYPILGNWEYKEHANAFTATSSSDESSTRLLKGGSYQIHLWKGENIASLLKLSASTPTKIKDL